MSKYTYTHNFRTDDLATDKQAQVRSISEQWRQVHVVNVLGLKWEIFFLRQLPAQFLGPSAETGICFTKKYYTHQTDV